MRFSTVAATLATMASVSALPQKIDPKTSPAPAVPLQVFADIPKIVVPISLEEAKKKFENDNDSSRMMLMAAAPAAALPTCANPRTRPEWDQYSDNDKQAFIDAVKCLMKKPSAGGFQGATTRYEDLVSLHQSLTPQIHGNDLFLLYHRYYLWTFEDMLRKECSFTRDMPWWDEAKYAGKFDQSSLFSAKWFGTLNSRGNCVTDGQFNSTSLSLHIGPGVQDQNHCLSRNYDAQTTLNCGPDYVNYCNGLTNFHSMSQCNEGGPHANGHNGIGGVMSDVYASPSDPLFWMHHSFVDRMYQNWQLQDPSRVAQIAGKDRSGKAISLTTQMQTGGIRPAVKISDVLNSQSTLLCYKYSY